MHKLLTGSWFYLSGHHRRDPDHHLHCGRIFHANHCGSRTRQEKRQPGPSWGERKHIPVWLTKHLLGRGAACLFQYNISFSSIIRSHMQSDFGEEQAFHYSTDIEIRHVFCALPAPSLNATSSGNVSPLGKLWNAVHCSDSSFIYLVTTQTKSCTISLLWEPLAGCQWCAETCWNLTWVPLLSSIFPVSVWCSTGVTASVDTVPAIMLDNEHSAEQIPPSLHGSETSLQSFLFSPCAWGQRCSWCAGLSGYTVSEDTTCYFFFTFLFGAGR